MKKLFTLILSLLAFGSIKAQVTSLNVVNNTGCTVVYLIHADPAYTCSPTLASKFISLAPFGSVFYPNSASIPGLPPAPAEIVFTKVLTTSNTSCPGFTSLPIGQPCSGWGTAATYFALTASCSSCSLVVATWTPPVFPSTMATLTFN